MKAEIANPEAEDVIVKMPTSKCAIKVLYVTWTVVHLQAVFRIQGGKCSFDRQGSSQTESDVIFGKPYYGFLMVFSRSFVFKYNRRQNSLYPHRFAAVLFEILYASSADHNLIDFFHGKW